MNRFANQRADRGQAGAYMALYTIAWSVAHIVGHTLGLNLVERFGFTNTWYFFIAVLLGCLVLLVGVDRMVKREG